MPSYSEEDSMIAIVELSFGLRQRGRRIGRGKDGVTKIAGHRRIVHCIYICIWICAKRGHKIVMYREW
jgi:hypothetical protein